MSFPINEQVLGMAELWRRYIDARSHLMALTEGWNWRDLVSQSKSGTLAPDIANAFREAFRSEGLWTFALHRCLTSEFAALPTRPEAFSLFPTVAKITRTYHSARESNTELSHCFCDAPFNLIRFACREQANLSEGEVHAVVTALGGWLVATKPIAHSRLFDGSAGPETKYLSRDDLRPESFWSDVYGSFAVTPNPPELIHRRVESEAEELEFIEELNAIAVPKIHKWCEKYATGTARRIINELRPTLAEIEAVELDNPLTGELADPSTLDTTQIGVEPEQLEFLLKRFSNEEKMILSLKVKQGFTHAEIANHMKISQRQVDQHMQNIQREGERQKAVGFSGKRKRRTQ